MPRLSSPDPQIDALLASSVDLQIQLQLFIDEGKYVSRRILPGFWQKFLGSPFGIRWRGNVKVPKIFDDFPDSVPPILDVICAQCGVTFPTNTGAVRCLVCVHGQQPVAQPQVQPQVQPQDDLFDLLARGLQNRLKPDVQPLDEAYVKMLIHQTIRE